MPTRDASRASRRRPPAVRLAAAATAPATGKRAKKRRVDGRPPCSLRAPPAPASAASSVRFLDSGDHAQHRARFVPDTTSEDEADASSSAHHRHHRRPRKPSAPTTTKPPLLPPSAGHAPSRPRPLKPQVDTNNSCAVLPPPPPPASVGPSVLRSLGSWSASMSLSSASSKALRRPSLRPGAALERQLLSASAYSASSHVEDGAVLAQARRAKKQLEAVAKRQVMVGRWKPLVRPTPGRQVFDSRGADGYSVVAKLNLPCSLREIMGVLATDRAGEFHRSMEALFGDLYVYGLGLRSVDCGALLAAGRRASGADKKRRSSQPARRPSFPAGLLPPLRTAKLSVNAVSLLQKRGLVWKQRNMCFLDLLEEKIDDKAALRVLQTMDGPDEELEDGEHEEHEREDDADEPSSVSMSASTAGSSSRHTHRQHARSDAPDRRRELHGITIGYILQEDSEEKFTRLLFHASVRPDVSRASKVSPSAVQLLRAMALKACALEAVVQRRRLGLYPLVPSPSAGEQQHAQVAYCSACYMPFSLLRKKHFCRLCGHYTCRKCSSVQDVEKTVGTVGRHRVCSACVRRVGYCVFSMGAAAFPPTTGAATVTSSASNALEASGAAAAALAEVPEDDAPPILEDLAATTIEDIATLNPDAGDIRAYVKSLLPTRRASRGGSISSGRRLSGGDLDAWMDDVEPATGRSTPPESITILDYCTSASRSSASSASAWFPASPSPAAAAAPARAFA